MSLSAVFLKTDVTITVFELTDDSILDLLSLFQNGPNLYT